MSLFSRIRRIFQKPAVPLPAPKPLIPQRNLYEEARATAIEMPRLDPNTVPAKYWRMYEQYLTHKVTYKDIEQTLQGEEEAEFWENYRLMYLESGNDSIIMLEIVQDRKTYYANRGGTTR